MNGREGIQHYADRASPFLGIAQLFEKIGEAEQPSPKPEGPV